MTKSKNSSRDCVLAKLYIGYEMECPLGHRFFLAAVDRAMSRYEVDAKKAARELLDSDIPIFMPCPCSRGAQKEFVEEEEEEVEEDDSPDESTTTTTMWAQLMRVYVAIPNIPIRVRVAPVVQVSDSEGPAFHLGTTYSQLVGPYFWLL